MEHIDQEQGKPGPEEMREHAKTLMGQFMLDQGMADHIVDCIIGASILLARADMEVRRG